MNGMEHRPGKSACRQDPAGWESLPMELLAIIVQQVSSCHVQGPLRRPMRLVCKDWRYGLDTMARYLHARVESAADGELITRAVERFRNVNLVKIAGRGRSQRLPGSIIPAIRHVSNIQWLYLDSFLLDQDDLLAVAQLITGGSNPTGAAACPKLSQLSLTDCNLPELTPDTIDGLEPFTRLTQLNISGAESSAWGYVPLLNKLTNLYQLDVSYTSLTPADFGHLTDLTKLRTLKYVRRTIPRNRLSSLDIFLHLPAFPSLTHLVVSLFNDNFSPAHLDGLRTVAQRLTHLELHGVLLNLERMGDAAIFPKLLVLKLMGQPAGAGSFRRATSEPLRPAFPLLSSVHINDHSGTPSADYWYTLVPRLLYGPDYLLGGGPPSTPTFSIGPLDILNFMMNGD